MQTQPAAVPNNGTPPTSPTSTPAHRSRYPFNTSAWWQHDAPLHGASRLRGLFPDVPHRYIQAKLRHPRSIQPGIDFTGGVGWGTGS